MHKTNIYILHGKHLAIYRNSLMYLYNTLLFIYNNNKHFVQIIVVLHNPPYPGRSLTSPAIGRFTNLHSFEYTVENNHNINTSYVLK